MSVSTVAVGPFPEGRRASAAWLLLAALGCGLVAGTVAVRAVARARQEVTVVVARRGVAPMARVAAGDVGLARVPAMALPAGTERTVDAVVGHFTRAGLVPGEIVTEQALAGAAADASAEDVRLTAAAGTATCAVSPPPAAPPGAAGGPCTDMVAMTLAVGADQGFGMVHPGDRVDLVASFGLAQGPAAQVIVADVAVLDRIGAGQIAGQAGPGAQTSGPESGWLVLALTPAQALRVQLAEAAGKVAVLLRPLGAPAPDPALEARVMTVPDLAGRTSREAMPPASAGVLPPPGGAPPGGGVPR